MANMINIGSYDVRLKDGMPLGHAAYYRGDGTHYVHGDLFRRDPRTNLTSSLTAQYSDDSGLRFAVSLSLTPTDPSSTGGRLVYTDPREGLQVLGKTTFLRYAMDSSGITSATFHPTVPLFPKWFLPVDLDIDVPGYLLSGSSDIPFIHDGVPIVEAPIHTRILHRALRVFAPDEGSDRVDVVLRTAGVSWIRDGIKAFQGAEVFSKYDR